MHAAITWTETVVSLTWRQGITKIDRSKHNERNNLVTLDEFRPVLELIVFGATILIPILCYPSDTLITLTPDGS